MDLEYRKKRFIEEFKKICNEQDIAKFEELLYENKNEENLESIPSLRSNSTNQSFLKKRKQQALQSYKEGNVKTTEQLLQKFYSVDR